MPVHLMSSTNPPAPLLTGLSILGLPWMCGATVQSLNHVRAMTDTKYNPDTNEYEVIGVTETRLTGLLVHAMLASSLLLLPYIRLVPTPVVSGIFLFLGIKLTRGNSFLQRICECFVEKNELPGDHPIQTLGRPRMVLFTLVQIICLMGLWNFKQNPSTAIFFPGAIGILMMIRSVILPRLFTEDELCVLGDPTPSGHSDDGSE